MLILGVTTPYIEDMMAKSYITVWTLLGALISRGALNITFKITEVGRLSILFDV